MIDICLPKDNEKELLEQAKKLGYKEVVFLYSTKKELLEKKKKYKKVGFYLRAKKISDLKKLDSVYLEADLIAVSSQDESIIRAAAENPRIDLLFEITSATGKDHLHYRYSGLNEIVVNIAKKSRQSYGLSFRYFLEQKPEARAKILGRELQNIRLTRRKIPIIIASFSQNPEQIRKPEDLQALSRVLGLNHPQSKASSLGGILDILTRKARIKSKEYVQPGVRIVK